MEDGVNDQELSLKGEEIDIVDGVKMKEDTKVEVVLEKQDSEEVEIIKTGDKVGLEVKVNVKEDPEGLEMKNKVGLEVKVKENPEGLGSYEEMKVVEGMEVMINQENQ